MNCKRVLFFCFGLLLQLNAASQNSFSNDTINDVIDSLKESTPMLEISTDYNSKVVFWGRDFGRKQFGFENSLIYKPGNGLFFNYTGNIWSAMPHVYAKTDLGAGYEHQFSDRFYAAVSYERWFFHNGSPTAKRALANYFEVNFNFDFNWLNVEPTVYYMAGLNDIIQLDLNINREQLLYSFAKTGYITVKPSAIATFTNQIFLPIYGEYPNSYANQKKINLVDLEVSLPLSVNFKNWEIEPTVHYNIPVSVDNERLTPFVYYSVHLSYSIYFNRGRIKKLYRSLH